MQSCHAMEISHQLLTYQKIYPIHLWRSTCDVISFL